VKRLLLDYLACPQCQGEYSIVSPADAGDEIEEGTLACNGCSTFVAIRGGIPDFTRAGGEPPRGGEVELTEKNFGYSWNNFFEKEKDFEPQFEAWLKPVTPADFNGKLVLDAGCGMGRHSELAASWGAKDVVAVDFSEAVFPAWRRLGGLPNAHVLRADIYALPLKRCFDLAYSVGVLHHLPDPRRGYAAVVSRVKPGGKVVAWVYGAEGNEWITRFLSPMREKVLSRMPMPLLKAAAFAATAGALYPALKAVYQPVSRVPFLKPLQDKLFYSSYLTSIAPYSFRHVYGIVFDHMLPPIAFYLPRAEVEEWLASEHLQDPTLRWHNGNSWTLIGNVPTTA